MKRPILTIGAAVKMATIALGFLVFGVFASAQENVAAKGKTASQLEEEFKRSLQELANFSPDPCGPPYGQESNWHSAHAESFVFQQASDIVNQGLNANPASAGSPRDRAAEITKTLEKLSAEITAAWPEKNRLHFEILDLPPALVVKMSVRAHETFSVFGIPEEVSGSSNHAWHYVGSGEGTSEHNEPQSWLVLYPLHRGPSGNARFLAKSTLAGCAGSVGVAYDAREWNPQGTGDLEQIIEQSGALGLDGQVPGFPRIGELRTAGPLVTLPYCWFSAIDT